MFAAILQTSAIFLQQLPGGFTNSRADEHNSKKVFYL